MRSAVAQPHGEYYCCCLGGGGRDSVLPEVEGDEEELGEYACLVVHLSYCKLVCTLNDTRGVIHTPGTPAYPLPLPAKTPYPLWG